MTTNNNLLRNLRVATPCHVGWENMSGNDRVRFCQSCQLNVYNLSEMTADEVKALIVKSEGRFCGRMYRRADGTLLTRNCPVGLKVVRLRVAKVAGTVFTTLLSICSITFSQTKGRNKESDGTRNYKIEVTSQKADGIFKGTVMDTAGAAVARAEVVLKKLNSSKTKFINTDEYGNFSFGALGDGHYSLTISSPGFINFSITDIALKANQDYRAEIKLEVGELLLGGIIQGYQQANNLRPLTWSDSRNFRSRIDYE
jgi:hypothetical protein